MSEIVATKVVSRNIVEGMNIDRMTYEVFKMVILLDMMDDTMISLKQNFSQKERNMTIAYKNWLIKRFGGQIEEFCKIDLKAGTQDMENMKKIIEDDMKYFIKANSK